MTSSIRPPRRLRGPWAPSTHATASTRFDLPDPFGPTTTVTPGSNSRTVFSANDLKPRRLSDLRNTRRALLCRPWSSVVPTVGAERDPAGSYLRGSRSSGTLQPEIAPYRTRKPGPGTTRGTRPPARDRRRGRGGAPWSRARSNLAGLTEERGPAADTLADDRLAAATARLAFPGVDLVVQLVFPRLAVEVDVLLVGERRPAVLHRLLERLDHRPVEPTDLLGRQRVAHAVPA